MPRHNNYITVIKSINYINKTPCFAYQILQYDLNSLHFEMIRKRKDVMEHAQIASQPCLELGAEEDQEGTRRILLSQPERRRVVTPPGLARVTTS